jgi:hypothetical protein
MPHALRFMRRERMRRQGAGEGEVASMLRLLADFEHKCLGDGRVSPQESKQVGLLDMQQGDGAVQHNRQAACDAGSVRC